MTWPTMKEDLQKALRIAEAAGTSTSFTPEQLRAVVERLDGPRSALVEPGERLVLEGHAECVELKLMDFPFNREYVEGIVTRDYVAHADVREPLASHVATMRVALRGRTG